MIYVSKAAVALAYQDITANNNLFLPQSGFIITGNL
jgi:hypothetical protein